MRELLKGYNRQSLITLAVLVTLCAAVGACWRELLCDNAADITASLIFIWVLMAALVCWNVSPREDAALACVSLAAGWGFEWWGTSTKLWYYFTGEAPPLWILPAWPVAALATRRIALAVAAICPARDLYWRLVYWFLMIVFGAGMVAFSWPAICRLPTVPALGLMFAVIFTGRFWRRDGCLFLGGAGLGVLLEGWGVAHNCWTYHDASILPVAMAAHGFAQVFYARVFDATGWIMSRHCVCRTASRP